MSEYDYTQEGLYFVTIVTQFRKSLFGEVIDLDMRQNDAGEMIAEVWKSLPYRYPEVAVDNFVVMPNHIHGIIEIRNVGAPLVGAPATVDGLPVVPEEGATTRVAPTLGAVIGAFKSLTTVEYTRGVRNRGWLEFQGRLWQRNYYEHIVRNDESHERIRRYIVGNPAQWSRDPENPARLA